MPPPESASEFLLADAFSCLTNNFSSSCLRHSACRSIPSLAAASLAFDSSIHNRSAKLSCSRRHVSRAFTSSSSTNDDTPDVPAVLVEIFVFLEEAVANAAAEGDDSLLVLSAATATPPSTSAAAFFSIASSPAKHHGCDNEK